MPDRLSVKNQRARKSHTCNNCLTAIQPGSEYLRETYINDGRIYDWLSCTECQKIADFVWEFSNQDDGGMSDQDFEEWALDAKFNPELREAALAYLQRRNESIGEEQ